MIHQGTKVLHTERLILRRFNIDDAHTMYEHWAKDERVTRFLTWPSHKSPELTRRLLEQWCEEYSKADYYNWVLEYEGSPIGNISAVRVDERSQWVELGYCMGYAYWGKGLMTEAARAVIDFLFQEVQVNRICISHAAENPGSGKVAQKCGLTYEGTKKEHLMNPWTGEIHDIVDYGIVRSQWLKQRG